MVFCRGGLSDSFPIKREPRGIDNPELGVVVARLAVGNIQVSHHSFHLHLLSLLVDFALLNINKRQILDKGCYV